MGRIPQNISNLLAYFAMAALFILAQFAAPNSHLKESQLSCSQSSAVIPFADMTACTNDHRYRAGCACGPIKNPWSTLYHFGLLPVLIALIGHNSLRGALLVQLVLMNGAVSFALVAEFVVAFVKDPNALMAIPILPFLAVGYCVIVTAWFFIFRISRSVLERYSNAT